MKGTVVSMNSDIEIAQEAVMKPITEVAKALGIPADDLELYGKYKAKISDELMSCERQSRWKVNSCYCNQSNSCRRR